VATARAADSTAPRSGIPSRSGVGTQMTYAPQEALSAGSLLNASPGVATAASGTSSMPLRPARSSATRSASTS
jgi:hypothetical protein